MVENKSGIEISIHDLLIVLVRRLWLIILLMVIAAGAAYAYSEYYVVPVYRSDVMFLVDPAYKSNYSDYTDAQLLTLSAQSSMYAKQITNTYLQILRTNSFREKLVEEYTAKHNKKINGTWSIYEIADTELFTIRVTSTSSKDAHEIAQTVETVAPEVIAELMGAERIRVADKAQEVPFSINNNTRRNMALGAFCGAVLAYGVGLLLFLFDTRVKSEDDLRNRYNIPILGGIVDFESVKKDNKK